MPLPPAALRLPLPVLASPRPGGAFGPIPLRPPEVGTPGHESTAYLPTAPATTAGGLLPLAGAALLEEAARQLVAAGVGGMDAIASRVEPASGLDLRLEYHRLLRRKASASCDSCSIGISVIGITIHVVL
jgi:hypothetical protein